MEVVVDFSSFLEVEMKVGNKIELRSWLLFSMNGQFCLYPIIIIQSMECMTNFQSLHIMEKEFFENLISRYLNAVDLSTVKAFAKHAEDIIKEEEEEEKKDEA